MLDLSLNGKKTTEMPLRSRLEKLIDEMLDGQIMLDEAMSEFEKLYIQKALARSNNHLSNTASTLGIHRNTLSKRMASYRAAERTELRLVKRRDTR